MGKLKASAAFYVLALAAQVSGYTSPGLALILMLVATGMLASAAWEHKDAIRTIGQRVHAAATFVWAGAAQAAPHQELLAGHSPYGMLIDQPRLESDESGRITLRGQYSRAGTELVAYVTYGQIGVGYGAAQATLAGKLNSIEPRIKLGTIPRFDRGEMADITLGYIISYKDSQPTIQWGERQLNNKHVGFTGAHYLGAIILVEKGGRESPFPFAFISRSLGMVAPAPSLILSPDLLLSHWELTQEARKR